MKGRSITPRNVKTESNPLSSREATYFSANMEIENILNLSSMRNKKTAKSKLYD